MIESADLAELLVRTRVKGEQEPWTDAEFLRVSNFLSASFRHFEVLHTHRRYNTFEEELWQGTEARLRDSLSNPGIREWWSDCKMNYSSSFASFVDSVSDEIARAQADAPADP